MSYKILIGIPADMPMPEKVKHAINEDGVIYDYECGDEDFDIWCDFELIQDERGYYFEFETMLGFDGEDGCRNWIMHCLSTLTHYMNDHGYNTNKELGMYTVFTEGVNVKTNFETIEDAYAWMKLIVDGFHGNGLSIK